MVFAQVHLMGGERWLTQRPSHPPNPPLPGPIPRPLSATHSQLLCMLKKENMDLSYLEFKSSHLGTHISSVYFQ